MQISVRYEKEDILRLVLADVLTQVNHKGLEIAANFNHLYDRVEVNFSPPVEPQPPEEESAEQELADISCQT